MLRGDERGDTAGRALSILIRSEERMLRCPPVESLLSAPLSILIRSEERMLPASEN